MRTMVAAAMPALEMARMSREAQLAVMSAEALA
jgi:hypothetical protein